jgi:hypothetical protein
VSPEINSSDKSTQEPKKKSSLGIAFEQSKHMSLETLVNRAVIGSMLIVGETADNRETATYNVRSQLE